MQLGGPKVEWVILAELKSESGGFVQVRVIFSFPGIDFKSVTSEGGVSSRGSEMGFGVAEMEVPVEIFVESKEWALKKYSVPLVRFWER